MGRVMTELRGTSNVEIDGRTVAVPSILVDELVRLRAFESKTLDLLNAVHRLNPDMDTVRALVSQLQAMRDA